MQKTPNVSARYAFFVSIAFQKKDKLLLVLYPSVGDVSCQIFERTSLDTGMQGC
jgi:hypothetical protein